MFAFQRAHVMPHFSFFFFPLTGVTFRSGRGPKGEWDYDKPTYPSTYWDYEL